MKLRISFFNIHVLRKNLTRFAPVWILFSIGEIMGLLSLGPGTKETFWLVDNLQRIMGPVAIFHAAYALVVAACLFGDLFNSRMCNGLHAMPMRREGWLLTNLVSGMVFALIPAVVGGVFGAVILQEYWWVAFMWQLTSLLEFTFFFGIAVFSAMCTGRRIGMIAVYAMINGFSLLTLWVTTLVYQPLLPGVMISNDWFVLFCPLFSFFSDRYFNLNISYSEVMHKVVFEGLIPEDWYYLLVCAGVGILLIVLAWRLYGRRHLETAGDFVSFRPVGMAFLIAYTFAAGALTYDFMGLFWGREVGYGFLAVGIVLGWFTGWMLLERTVKIFHKKVLVGFAAFAVFFAASIGLTVLDPLGIAAYIPDSEKVENVSMYFTADQAIYEREYHDWGGWYITDPEEMARVQQLHKQMYASQTEHTGETIAVYVRYEMKNGSHIRRNYNMPAESQIAQELKPFFSDVRAALSTDDWDRVRDTVEYVQIYFYYANDILDINDRAQMQGLLDAIQADAQAGTLAQHDFYHRYQEQVASIDVTWNMVYAYRDNGEISGTVTDHVRIFEDCVNTVAYLNSLKSELNKN